MSDYLLAFNEDIEKQMDNERSAKLFKQKRHRKYIIREQEIAFALLKAEYDTDANVHDTLDLLSLHLQGYVSGLRWDLVADAREQQSTDDEVIDESGEEQTIEISEVSNLNDNFSVPSSSNYTPYSNDIYSL